MEARNCAAILAISAVASAVAVYCCLIYARHVALLDHPSARSSHAAPTPRGGGLGLLAGIAVAGLTGPVRSALGSAPAAWFAVVAVILVAVIGWIDDHRSLSAVSRLIVHVVAATLVGIATAVIVRSRAGFAAVPEVAVALAAGATTVAAINVVNFMDGIDGLVATAAVVFGLTAAAIGGEIGASGAQIALALALAGSAIGFLVWNWSPARIFMGDVGSGALGAVFVIVATGLADRPSTLVLLALPLAPLIVDASLTLVQRARRGEHLSDAHRVHLYQRLAASSAHAPIAAAYALVGAACGLLAIACLHMSDIWRIAVALAVAALLMLAWFTVPQLAGCAPLLPRASALCDVEPPAREHP